MAGEGPLTFGATVALACTTTTGSVALNLPAGQQLIVTNLGPDLAYIAVGTTGVTATTSGFPVLPGTQIAISLPINTTFVAGICPTSTAALRLSSGDGYVSGIGAASSGASGGTTDDVAIVAPLGQKVSAASVSVALSSDGGQATSANQTNASQKTQVVDGSGNVAGSQSFAGSANFLNVTTPDELPFSGTASSAIVIPVSINGGATQAFIDMSGYESISVQVTGAGSATTLTYEASDDNATWATTSGLSTGSVGATNQLTSSTAAQAAFFPKHLRYFRVRVSTYGSGTVTIVGNLHKNPQPLTNRITVDGPVTGATAASSLFPIALAARSTNITALANSNSSSWISTLLGVGITKPYSIPAADWTASVSLSTTGSTALQAAGGAGIRNYLTAIQFSGNAALVANTIQVLDGVTVIWGPHTIAAATALTQITFPTPLRTSAAAALNVQIGTTPVGALEVTGQGYQAADY